MDFPSKIKIIKEHIESSLDMLEENYPDEEITYQNGRKDISPGWHREINGLDGFCYIISELTTVNELEGDRNYGEEKVIISEAEHRDIINYLASKDYIEIIENKPPKTVILVVLPKTRPIIKPKALELIAKELKDYYTGADIISLLKEAGVDKRLIVYPQSKWAIFYTVFAELTNYEQDRELLFKTICDAIHPLNLNGNQEKANELQAKFNGHLKYDGLEICYAGANQTYVISDSASSPREQSSENFSRENKMMPKELNNYIYAVNYKNKKVILKDARHCKECILSKPQFNEPNDLFMSYIVDNPDKKIRKEDIEKSIGRKIPTEFHQLLSNLGFKGEMKRIFFPGVSNNSICFKNNITESDIADLEIDGEKLQEQINGLMNNNKQ